MTCTECKRHAPSRHRVWSERDTERLREQGWFFWDRSAPVEFHGVVVCPECRGDNPAAEKQPARPMKSPPASHPEGSSRHG